jgi:hypothetical protein
MEPVMEAGEAKIHKVLDGTKQFLVPHYQRPYSWGEREWEALWRDIVELATDDGAQPHFMGSIVTAPGRAVPEGVEKRLLIDGQQRLTTLVVLLALIRQRAIAADMTKLANRIAGLLMNRDEEGSLDFYKLLPTQGDSAAASDREALLALLDRREPTTVSRIIDASRFFTTKLARPDAPDLDRLFSTLTARLTLVSIILDKHDNPYRIFESLNGKGLPLTQVDLIRNYFFMRLPEAEHERVYRAKWQPMQQRLGEEGLTEFVRHYLMMAGQLVKEADVYATLKERADNGDPRQHLDDLVAFAGHYAVLLDPSKAPTPALQQRLARLKRLDVTVAYPFLLAAYADMARGALTADQLVATLDTVETYLVRRFVCGVATHGLNKVFTPLYQQVKQEADFVEGTKTLLAARACPRDDEFRDRLESARLYGNGERRTKTAFILGRLEAALGHKELVDVTGMQVEHVMPQTLTEWWRAHLGDDWEDAHDQLLHTLGNLTLTNYNSELSNRPFADKRAAFLDSHVGLNAYFRDLDHWNEGEITRRGEALAELALGVWPYFGPIRVEPAVRVPRERVQGDDVTSTLPQSLTFRGARVPVRSWREVLTKTFELVLAAEPDAFGRVLEEFTGIVGMDPSAFRRSSRLGRLSNGAYLELNLSALAVYRVCQQVLGLLGIGPDEWQVERVSLAADPDDDQDEPTETKQLQHEFWTLTRAALDATGKFKSLQAARPRFWFDVEIGRSGAWISLNAGVAHGRLTVKLTFNEEGAAEMLPGLEAVRADIEREIGSPLEWNPHPEKKFKTIRISRPFSFADRAAWDGGIRWLTTTAVAFKQAFAPRVAST